MPHNQHTNARTDVNVQPVRKHPYPPAITEHPSWKRLMDFLLQPTPEELEAAGRQQDDKAA